VTAAREAPARVLVVDDAPAMAEMIADGLVDRGYEAEVAASGAAALARLEAAPFDALVTDLRMPGFDGLELVARARALAPTMPVLVMTAFGAGDSAVESIRRGAYHYLTKPFKLDELALFLERALDERDVRREATLLRAALADPIAGMVGASEAMRELFELVARVAPAEVPVLVLGETGTGKGLVARALHARSARASGPFVTVNCAALPEALLESELFGHARGAFTGAVQAREGILAAASGGTLLLDEVAEMSPAVQAKLLDVIERRKARAVGEARERDVDVRIVAATHKDLGDLVARGAFREDLRYRLDVVSIEVPPLRDRPGDVPLLVEHFLALARARHPTAVVRAFSPAAMRRLAEQPFPGNVRELGHLVERLVLLGRAEIVDEADLPAAPRAAAGAGAPAFAGPVLPIRELQRRYARFAMEQLGGHKARVAEALGVDKKTLAKWLTPPAASDDDLT
jgi:two-component system response regulator HydG